MLALSGRLAPNYSPLAKTLARGCTTTTMPTQNCQKIFENLQTAIVNMDRSCDKVYRNYKVSHSIPGYLLALRTLKNLNLNFDYTCRYDSQKAKLIENLNCLLANGYSIHGEEIFTYLKEFGYDSFLSSLHILARHAQNIEAVDQHGWTLLHWAVFRNLPELAKELTLRGLNGQTKDYYGITAYDLALWTLNREMIARLKPEADVNEELANISPHFFASLVIPIDTATRGLFGCFYGLAERAVPDVSKLQSFSAGEKNFLRLYNWMPLSDSEGCTPMYQAMKTQDLSKIKELIQLGWCNEIEGLSIRKQWSLYQKTTNNFSSGLSELIEDDKNLLLLKAVKLALYRSNHSPSAHNELNEKFANWGKPKNFPAWTY